MLAELQTEQGSCRELRSELKHMQEQHFRELQATRIYERQKSQEALGLLETLEQRCRDLQAELSAVQQDHSELKVARTEERRRSMQVQLFSLMVSFSITNWLKRWSPLDATNRWLERIGGLITHRTRVVLSMSLW